MGLFDRLSPGHKKHPAFLSGFSIFFLAVFLFSSFSFSLFAQRNGSGNRITAAINDKSRVSLPGHLHPRVAGEEDEGAVNPQMPMTSMTLVLKASDDQQAALDTLLAAQQDPASPEYHKWLTPEEFGNRFGISDSDLQKITSWIESQGLKVTATAKARNSVTFSGTAAQVSSAFGTEIHHYRANGKVNYANAAEPTIPAALAGVVKTVHGLNDYRLKHPHRILAQPEAGSGDAGLKLDPKYTSASGTHYLAPDDFATIYNVKPLHQAGIDGSGQKIVVVGQTEIKLADLQHFRTFFNLPPNDPQQILIPTSTSPGVVNGDLDEAHLDLEWSGAVARNALIIYVYGRDVLDAVQYAIDQNLAPVLSMSYGLCEPLTSRSDALTMQAWARQANAQGITWFAASGDAGATDCLGGSSTSNGGLAVDVPASLPEVTGVGGLTFNEGSGSYWNATGDANRASALSYIPEMVWNDSQSGDPASGGGGSSVFFTKPSWQTGAGVPDSNQRHVPDVALAGSAQHDGYLYYSEGVLGAIGGTSAGAPTFAGLAVLLNHYLVSTGAQSSAGLGNINANLYRLAQTTPGAFHDITTGSNIINVTCGVRARNCTTGSFGFTAEAGYDRASGLGSVDANKLITSWNGNGPAASRGTTTTSLSATSSQISYGQTSLVTVTVTGSNGMTPTGAVKFSTGGLDLGTAVINGSNGVARAVFSVDSVQLTPGPNAVLAVYGGDGGFDGSNASLTINVTTTSTLPPQITGLANGASFRTGFAPGMVLTVFGQRLAPVSASAQNVPLPVQLAGTSATINGIAAPLYYISGTQLNVQIPYEVPAGSTATLVVTNNQQTSSMTFDVAAAAPGIFTDGSGAVVPSSAARRGQVITVYATGAGLLSPAIGTGAAPAPGTPVGSLPKPVGSVGVSVGGVPATIQFAGIPIGLAGVMQINLVVPATAPTGSQALTVSIGTISSPPATVQVQ